MLLWNCALVKIKAQKYCTTVHVWIPELRLKNSFYSVSDVLYGTYGYLLIFCSPCLYCVRYIVYKKVVKLSGLRIHFMDQDLDTAFSENLDLYSEAQSSAILQK